MQPYKLLSPVINTGIPFYCRVIVFYLFCLMAIRTFLFVVPMNKSSMNTSHDYIWCVCVGLCTCTCVCVSVHAFVYSLNLEHTVSPLVWQSAGSNDPSVSVCPAVPGFPAHVATSGFLCCAGIWTHTLTLVLQALLSTKHLLGFQCESFQELTPCSFVCGKHLRVESLGWCMFVFEREETLKITSLSCPQLSSDSTAANINSTTAQVQRDSLPWLSSSLLY